MIIQAISIKKTIGGNPLFEDLSCQIEAGEKIALVGINGTGKSTFLQILTGREGVDSGVISRKKGLKIGTVEQELTVSEKRPSTTTCSILPLRYRTSNSK